MAEALEDPSEVVRGSALQVLSDITLHHSSVPVDVDRIISALDYPATSDRSKALGVLVGLKVNSPDDRAYLAARASPHMLDLLRMSQPCVHDMAFTLLRILSQETFGQRDYAAWGRWISAQKSPPPPKGPKPK